MDHIVRGNEDAHLLAHRNHHWIVHFQKIVLALRRLILYLISRCRQVAVEGDVFSEIVVAPLPLVTGDLDGHVRIGGVLHREHGPGRRKGHPDDNEARNQRPQDLCWLVVVELLGLMAHRSTMPHDSVEHESEHHDRNEDADAEDDGVQVINLMRDDGLRCLERELRLAVGDGRARQRQRRHGHSSREITRHH